MTESCDPRQKGEMRVWIGRHHAQRATALIFVHAVQTTAAARLRSPARLAVVGLALVTIVIPAWGLPADAQLSAAPTCTQAQLVGVRGSGDQSDPRDLGDLIGPLYNSLAAQLRDPSSLSYYGLPYPDQAIDWSVYASFNATYQNSKDQGDADLTNYLESTASSCPNEKLIVVGYSQGAHVVGDVFSRGTVGALGGKVLNNVAAVELFGDPRFNSREPYDRGSFNVGRNGLLGARTPGDLTALGTKVRSWCRGGDIVCQGPGSAANHEPTKYLGDYGAQAVDYLLNVLSGFGLRRQNLNHPSYAELGSLVGCASPCVVTGYITFTHPTWGRSYLVTTNSAQPPNCGGAQITALDAHGNTRWHQIVAQQRRVLGDPRTPDTTNRSNRTPLPEIQPGSLRRRHCPNAREVRLRGLQ